MKIVKVTYTTQADYSAQNKANIKTVMAAMQQINSPDINYNVCVCADDKTFIHTAFFTNDEDQKILLELPEFKHFQQQLKASGPEAGPKQEFLDLVGSTRPVL